MLNNTERIDIQRFSIQAQMEVVKMIAGLPAGHLGGSLSICDLLSVLYNRQMRIDPSKPDWKERDWLVNSKGHSGPALYATLALKGYFPMEMLQTINRPHTDLPSHCDRNHTPGVDMTTGSLGQGASLAAGVACGFQMDHADNRVYLILGDGEINEGQVWEMALFASTKKLGNLTVFVDFNKLQIDGRTDDDSVCNLGDIPAKFSAFGWHAQRVDGHDVAAIDEAIEHAKQQTGTPSVIVLDTVKGHGWSQSEGQVGSHSRAVSEADLKEALAEMEDALARLN